MQDFIDILYKKVISSLDNDYKNNHDEERFGAPVSNKGIKGLVRKKIDTRFISKGQLTESLVRLKEISVNKDRFQYVYDLLSDETSKKLLVDIWAFRVLGSRYVKLAVNSDFYWDSLKKLKDISDKGDVIDPKFMHFKLPRHDLRSLGKNVQLYFTSMGILTDFFLEQYKYHSEEVQIEAKNDDVVIDAGGCWGDTAIYFASKLNEKGKVFTFEFIPGNIEIFRKNIAINPHLSEKIEIIENPVWNISGQKVFFSNNGPGSVVSSQNFDGAFGSTETVSIDDFFEKKGLTRLDFLKMDIEGAEPFALEGAKRTIMKFKPDLAIAIYHGMDDFLNIPKWIIDLNAGYKLYLGHYTIHAEETVLFATTK
ncbi:MAG: FkbM family methyltransferase [Bacteroidota bacterium]|nr:FkbM family methyltransferase [Bacteroidota bacterium]